MQDFLEYTVADVERAEAVARTEVMPRYEAEDEAFSADPRARRSAFDGQRSEQLVTLLLQLGYLEEPAAGASEWSWSRPTLELAWAEWARERRGEDLAALGEEERLRRELKACVSLEGEVSLLAWPEAGERSLLSRVALFRLRLFGQLEGRAGDAMPAGLAGALRQRARWVADGQDWTALDIVNRLGNLPGLCGAIAVKLEGSYIALRPARGGSGGPKSKAARGGGNQGARFASARLSQAGAARLLNVEDPSGRAWNELSVLALQARLWTLGYYEGEIDGAWSELSEAALARFIREYELERVEGLRTLRVSAGVKALRVSVVFERMATLVDGPAKDTERSEIDAALSDEAALADDRLWAALAAESEQEGVEREEGAPVARLSGGTFTLAHGTNLRRRRYFGWRGVFAAFGRALRRVGGFVAGLLKALRAGLAHARSIARYVVGATRTAARVATLAVKRLKAWLLGTPVVSGAYPGVAATRWSLDFDTVTFVDRSCPVERVGQHVTLLDWMQRSFGVMIEIAQGVTGLLLSLGNWLLFAWRAWTLARAVEQLNPSSRHRWARRAAGSRLP